MKFLGMFIGAIVASVLLLSAQISVAAAEDEVHRVTERLLTFAFAQVKMAICVVCASQFAIMSNVNGHRG